jgi:hypothetical protein
MSTRFQVQQIGGVLGTVTNLADPNTHRWEFMAPIQRSLTGRIVQQGRMSCTLTWEYMAASSWAALMAVWFACIAQGNRLAAVTLPPYRGSDLSSWPTCYGSGSPGEYLAMHEPKGQSISLYWTNISVTFDDLEMPVES